jgi:hypothetical protein
MSGVGKSPILYMSIYFEHHLKSRICWRNWRLHPQYCNQLGDGFKIRTFTHSCGDVFHEIPWVKQPVQWSNASPTWLKESQEDVVRENGGHTVEDLRAVAWAGYGRPAMFSGAKLSKMCGKYVMCSFYGECYRTVYCFLWILMGCIGILG